MVVGGVLPSTMDTMVGVLCPGRTLHHGLELREGGKAMMWGPMGCAEILGFIPRERHRLGGFKQKRDTVQNLGYGEKVLDPAWVWETGVQRRSGDNF